MVNCYKVNYTGVTISGPKQASVRTGKDGSCSVIAETPQEAGSLAATHQRQFFDEVNVTGVHEIAKDIING